MTDGRNEDGTFAAGNTFSDGRNKHLHAAELRQLFCEAINEGEIQRLAYKLMGMALDGDLQAAKLLLSTAFKDVPTVAVVAPQQASGDQRKRSTVDIVARIRAENAGKTPEEIEQRRRESLRRAGWRDDEDPTPSQLLARMQSDRQRAAALHQTPEAMARRAEAG